MEGSPMPMDQGHYRTCVGYAFAQSMAVGVRSKYNVALCAEKVVEKVKTLCPCWEGYDTEQMTMDWNAKVDSNPAGASFDVGDQVYCIKVDAKRINTFDDAYKEVAVLQTMLLPTATIGTATDGHDRHSVVLMRPYPGERKIQALNSWGANQMHMEVTPTNFQYAVRVEPMILSATKILPQVEKMAIPPVHKLFTSTLKQGLFNWINNPRMQSVALLVNVHSDAQQKVTHAIKQLTDNVTNLE
jgi:hypothetical protein